MGCTVVSCVLYKNIILLFILNVTRIGLKLKTMVHLCAQHDGITLFSVDVHPNPLVDISQKNFRQQENESKQLLIF